MRIINVKIWLLVYTLICCALAQDTYQNVDIFNEFTNYTFQPVEQDEKNYKIIFEKIKNGFCKDVITVQDLNVGGKFQNYVKIRNKWLENDNIYNYIMAIELTKVMLLALTDFVCQPKLFDNNSEYEKVVAACVANVLLKKYDLFPVLDKEYTKIKKNWKSLGELEPKKIEGKTSGWLLYVKNVELQYVKDLKTNYKYLTNSDTSFSYDGTCVIKLLSELNIANIIFETALVIDIGKTLQETFQFILSNNFENDTDKLVVYIHQTFCKKENLWLYMSQIKCDQKEMMGHIFYDKTLIEYVFYCLKR
jgi:hypothetical protein